MAKIFKRMFNKIKLNSFFFLVIKLLSFFLFCIYVQSDLKILRYYLIGDIEYNKSTFFKEKNSIRIHLFSQKYKRVQQKLKFLFLTLEITNNICILYIYYIYYVTHPSYVVWLNNNYGELFHNKINPIMKD